MSSILIADAEVKAVKSLTRVLRRAKHEVESASSERELEKKLEQKKPDVVLLDASLPSSNGRKALETVRDVAGNVPVLMLCSEASGTQAEVLEGATDFVFKPVQKREVVARVRRAIAASHRRAIRVPQRELHDPETGRIDAQEIARFLSVPLTKLAGPLGVKYPTLHKTPAALSLQPKLRPIKEAIDLVSQITATPADAKAWLNYPHPDLGGKAPMELILEGYAGAVVTLLSNALQGIPS